MYDGRDVTKGRPPLAGGRSPGTPLLPRILLAVVILAYAAIGAYWLNAGELPGLPTSTILSEAMPARGGPEPTRSALLQPPAQSVVHQPPVPTRSPEEAAPQPAASPDPAPAAAAASPPPRVPAVPHLPSVGGTAPSLTALPAPPPASPLGRVPLPELIERTPNGHLPTIGPGNRQSWQAYAHPFRDDTSRPRIAVMVTGLGLSKERTELAIAKLPAAVSLAFSPYAPDLQRWIEQARQAGHEVLLELPLEPPQFPARDPGPLGLLVALSSEQASTRLEKVMASAVGYVGLAGLRASPFADTPSMAAALAVMNQRGVLYAGDSATPAAHKGVLPAFAPMTEVIDTQPFRDAIDARLNRVAVTARSTGSALAVTEPLPVALERLVHWLGTLPQDGLVLAPVSAVATPPSGADS